jgi:8-amino-7-oxononanoate synthase
VPVAAATAAGIRLLAEHPEMRDRLWENARSLKQGLAELGLETDESPVPIVCLRVGNADQMKRIQQGLAGEGIMIAYAGAYSGLGAEGGLRLAVCSEHTPAMIGRLVEGIGKLITK